MNSSYNLQILSLSSAYGKNIYSDVFLPKISLFIKLFSKFAPEYNKLKNGEFESTKSRISRFWQNEQVARRATWQRSRDH